ncbi:hypothetical protein DSECCO2_473170 [anaerobic digester metagenome]
MSDCLYNCNWNQCSGCNPECRRKEEARAAGYQGKVTDDSHRRCQGLHTAIHKVLKKRLQLQSKDVCRLGVSYILSDTKYVEGEEIQIVTDGSQNYLDIMVEIKKNAFIMGKLDRSYDGEIEPCHFDLGHFWIGRTRYKIYREVV